ncbi:MAG: hypothetical protein ACO35I_09790, partial [Burkholderiaceae bacterium]
MHNSTAQFAFQGAFALLFSFDSPNLSMNFSHPPSPHPSQQQFLPLDIVYQLTIYLVIPNPNDGYFNLSYPNSNPDNPLVILLITICLSFFF